MKKVILVLLALMLCVNAYAAGIIKADTVITNGGLSVFLNESDGSVSELDISSLAFVYVGEGGCIKYNVSYNIVGNTISACIRIMNFHDTDKSVSCTAALYRNGVFCNISMRSITVKANRGTEITLSPFIFNEETDEIKVHVWDSIAGMQPLGNAERIDSLDNVIYREYVYVECESQSEFEIFTTAPAFPLKKELKYKIEYNSEKAEAINLCGFSYNPVLTEGYIPLAGINITEFTPGVIEFSSGGTTGLSGASNILKFKACEQLRREPITVTVTK